MSSEIKSNCCTNVKSKSTCPKCNEEKRVVAVQTLKHWLITSLVPFVREGPYYFCDTIDCENVYFSGDHSIQYNKKQIRDRIASKETSSPSIVCYCFGVTKEMIFEEILETGKSTFITWIANEVKQGNCACEVRNPEGACCLGEVKKVEADLLKTYEENKNSLSKTES